MHMSKRDEIHAIEKFLEWVDPFEIQGLSPKGRERLAKTVAQYAEEVLTECDTAIMHGPGHQSISECINTGEHTYHYSDMGHEWTDKDVTKQTYTKYRYDNPPGVPEGEWVSILDKIKTPIKTFRLASEPY